MRQLLREAELEGLLAHAIGQIRLLARVTPTNQEAETRRLTKAFAEGSPSFPQPTYGAPAEELAPLRMALDELATQLEADGASTLGPIAPLYAARARELALDCDVALAVGTLAFARRAATRFDDEDSAAARDAEALAAAWLGARAGDAADGDDATVWSDGPEPSSLLARLRAEVYRRKLPFRVVPHAALGALAAVGEGAIFVATNRKVTREDVERTVVHELDGHAEPRARARQQTSGIFRVGTAKGGDDQEGYALLCEERAGFLRGARRRELAMRHAAVLAMRRGADFVEVVRLLHTHAPIERAVRTTLRVFRGGTGRSPGVGRERIYLESYLRLRRHLAACPADEPIVASGQVAVAAAPALRGVALVRAMEPDGTHRDDAGQGGTGK